MEVFEQMFKLPVFAMKLNRSYPDVPRNIKWCIQFFCTYGVFTLIFSVVFNNVIINIRLGNFSEACRHSILSVIYFEIALQYIILVANQKNITKLIEMVKTDLARDMTKEERDIISRYASIASKVCKCWAILVLYTVAIFVAKNLYLECQAYVMIGEFELLEPYAMTYPSPVEEYKQHSVVYAILYVAVVYFGLYACSMYIGFVPLGPLFMMHACGQLEIVKKRVSALYSDGSSTEEIEHKLKEIVKYLQYVYGFVEYTKESFKVFYELMLKFTAVFLPVTLYQVLESFGQREVNIEFINFMFSGILICSLPCYFGDLLMEKGEEVRMAVYSCGWETRYDHGVRKTLMVILLRASRPVAIRTMYRIVNLDALTELFHQAYSIFSLMNAAWS